MTKFMEMLNKRFDAGKFVCVGLDTDSNHQMVGAKDHHPVPLADSISMFNTKVIDKTIDYAAAYKLNFGFYIENQTAGISALNRAIEYIKRNHRDHGVPIILDGKWADIGASSEKYASTASGFGVDAVTLNPYFGDAVIDPFLKKELFMFVVCKSSNKARIQDKIVEHDGLKMPLYLSLAHDIVNEWGLRPNLVGFVVGATHPIELRQIRRAVNDMLILAPGIGKQGGDLEETLGYGKNNQGRGILVNSSSGIIFAPDPGLAAKELNDRIAANL